MVHWFSDSTSCSLRHTLHGILHAELGKVGPLRRTLNKTFKGECKVKLNVLKNLRLLKRDETGSFVRMWMDLESVIQSKLSQKEENKYCMLMRMYGI